MYFVKLNKKFDLSEYKETNVFVRYGRMTDIFRGTQYFNLEKYDSSIYDVIPERYREDFTACLLKINYNIRAHTDSEITATINFYLETNSFKTSFYSFKSNDHTEIKIANQTNGSVFDFKDLNEERSFVAENGEAWLLDVTKPHSVLADEPLTRVALCLQTKKFNYDQVVEMLKETGYIS